MKVKVPVALLKRVARNYRLLAASGVFDRRDTRVANALRVARNDSSALTRLIDKAIRDGG